MNYLSPRDFDSYKWKNGDHVYLRGTYRVRDFRLDGLNNITIVGENAEIICTPDRVHRYPLRISDCQNIDTSGVKFSGGSGFSQVFVTGDSSDIHFKNVEVDGFNDFSVGFRAGIMFATFYDDAKQIDRVSVLNSTIYNAGANNGNNDGVSFHGVRSDGVISGNDIFGCSGEAIDVAGGINHIIGDNYLRDNFGAGLKMHSQQYDYDGGSVFHNLIVNNGGTKQFQAQIVGIKNVPIFNNTFFQDKIGVGCARFEEPKNPTNGESTPNGFFGFIGNQFFNNILVGDTQSQGLIDFFDKLPSQYEIDNYIGDNCFNPINGMTKIISDAFSAAEDLFIAGYNRQDLLADPLLDRQFNLKITSPCIKTGVSPRDKIKYLTRDGYITPIPDIGARQTRYSDGVVNAVLKKGVTVPSKRIDQVGVICDGTNYYLLS